MSDPGSAIGWRGRVHCRGRRWETRAVISVVAVLGALVMRPPPTLADEDADALRALFQQVQDHMQRGEYEQALAPAREALALDNSPAYRCNLGNVYYKLKRWPQAHLLLGLCLGEPDRLDAAHVVAYGNAYALVESRLDQGPFGRIEVATSPKGATVAVSGFEPFETFAAPRTIWLTAGQHTLSVTADGYAAVEQPVTVAAGQTVSFEVTLQPTSPPGDPEPRDEPREDPPPPPRDTRDTTGERTLSPQPSASPSRRNAWIAFSISGAALIGGVLFHAAALDTRSEVALLPNSPERDARVSDLERERLVMVSLYGVSALALGAGVYLWIRASRDARSARPPIGATVGSGGASAWVRWAF